MITNTVINKIRYRIPQVEIAILCCCLPSLIQQILYKSPWLTPNDIIQCLTADIIVTPFFPLFINRKYLKIRFNVRKKQ